MQMSIAPVVGMFAISIWDIVQNHGALSRAVLTAFVHLGRSVGVY